MKFSKSTRFAVAAAVVAGSVAGAGAVSAAPTAPDLVVTAVNWSPGTAAGQHVLFSATIANRGTAPTPAGTISGIAFQVDGKLVTWSDQRTAALAPGESATLEAVGGPAGSATWTATAGQHRLRAFVDDAHRIRESDEGNNTLDTTVAVTAGITHRVQSGSVVASLAPLDQPTVTATSVTGNVYAGCFAPDGTLVDGTERFLQTFTVGNDTVALGSKWSDGLAQLPARAARSRTSVSFSRLLYSYQGHYPVQCATGTPGFTRFQATSVRTTRWAGSFGGVGAQIATASTPVDVDLDVVV